jgi:Tfp pilus assembly protein PilV
MTKNKASGFSFIEVMISLMLMVLILFGINEVHLLALNEAKEAYYYLLAGNQAKMLADDLALAKPNEWLVIADLFNRNINQMLPNGRLHIPDLEKRQLTVTWGTQGRGKLGSLIFNLSKML